MADPTISGATRKSINAVTLLIGDSIMNHQSRNRYYSDERGRERRNRDRLREENPAWDFEDEDEDFQGGRMSRYRSWGQRNRGSGRSFSEDSSGARGQRDDDEQFGGYGQGGYGQGGYAQGGYRPGGYRQDESSGGRRGYSQRNQGDWDEEQRRGRGSGSRNYGRDYESAYGDFEESYRHSSPDYGSSGASNYGQRGASQRSSQQYGGLPSSANYWYAEYWLVPGPYSGTGPKGYQRSSESLKEQVCERLEEHGEIDASEIEVAIQNGEVTLSGKVESREQKRMAEDCACSVRGVKDVHNQLKVDTRKPSKSEDLSGESKSADKKTKSSPNPAF
jgi:hypothetical protein